MLRWDVINRFRFAIAINECNWCRRCSHRRSHRRRHYFRRCLLWQCPARWPLHAWGGRSRRTWPPPAGAPPDSGSAWIESAAPPPAAAPASLVSINVAEINQTNKKWQINKLKRNRKETHTHTHTNIYVKIFVQIDTQSNRLENVNHEMGYAVAQSGCRETGRFATRWRAELAPPPENEIRTDLPLNTGGLVPCSELQIKPYYSL